MAGSHGFDLAMTQMHAGFSWFMCQRHIAFDEPKWQRAHIGLVWSSAIGTSILVWTSAARGFGLVECRTWVWFGRVLYVGLV